MSWGIFNDLIEAIDKFLLIADDNNDGLLHYPEFVKAVTGGKEQLALERNLLRWTECKIPHLDTIIDIA